MSIAKYKKELLNAQKDHKIQTGDSLVLTLTPIMEDYNLPVSSKDSWVCQHWRAMPRPQPGHPDFREFGYFFWNGIELSYTVIPADNIEIQQGVEIIPLQTRRVHVARRVPSAVNYFPNSQLVLGDKKERYYLRGV